MIYRLRRSILGKCILQSCGDDDNWDDHPWLGVGRDRMDFKILTLDSYETLLAQAERGRKADKRAQSQAHAMLTRTMGKL